MNQDIIGKKIILIDDVFITGSISLLIVVLVIISSVSNTIVITVATLVKEDI